MVATEQLDQWISEARDLGAEHAHNAASWSTDGNMDVEERRKVLEMMRAGDPMADEYLPRMPNLSGEYADDPTPQSLYADITGESTDEPVTDAQWQDIYPVVDALADAYMDAVSETFGPACEAELIRFCEK